MDIDTGNIVVIRILKCLEVGAQSEEDIKMKYGRIYPAKLCPKFVRNKVTFIQHVPKEKELDFSVVFGLLCNAGYIEEFVVEKTKTYELSNKGKEVIANSKRR